MEKLQGSELGRKLKELAGLSEEDQPYVVFFISSENTIYEGMKLVPKYSQASGDMTRVGMRMDRSDAVKLFYYRAKSENKGPKEITWLQVT